MSFEAILMRIARSRLSALSSRSGEPGRLRRVHGQEVLDAHHAAIPGDELRVARRHALHRLERAARMTVRAGLARSVPSSTRARPRPRRAAPRDCSSGRGCRRSQPAWRASSDRAPGSFSGGSGAFCVPRNATIWTMSSGFRTPPDAPRRHDRVREEMARIVDELKVYSAGRFRSPYVDRSGPTLPAGQTSGPWTR